MKLLLAFLIVAASTASAISIGFIQTDVPSYQYVWELESHDDIYMITVGEKLGNALNIEISIGYSSEKYDEDSSSEYGDYYNKTTQAYGLGAFYRITGNDFVSFSLGARFVYSDLELKPEEEPKKVKTTTRTFSPLARIDLSIPGVENLFLHTQFGVNYRQVESINIETYFHEYEYDRTDFSTTAPGEILAGIYYQF